MPNPLRGLLDRNILTALAVTLITACVLTAFVAAVTGHYDSVSVRAFIDDLKYLAAALGLGAGIGRGLIAAGHHVADGHIEAAIGSDLEPRDANVKPQGVATEIENT